MQNPGSAHGVLPGQNLQEYGQTGQRSRELIDHAHSMTTNTFHWKAEDQMEEIGQRWQDHTGLRLQQTGQPVGVASLIQRSQISHHT